MRISRLVRRVAVISALTLVTLGVPARTASALPRYACQDYANLAEEHYAMSRWWRSVADLYFALGAYDAAAEASLNAETHSGFAIAYTTMFQQRAFHSCHFSLRWLTGNERRDLAQ